MDNIKDQVWRQLDLQTWEASARVSSRYAQDAVLFTANENDSRLVETRIAISREVKERHNAKP